MLTKSNVVYLGDPPKMAPTPTGDTGKPINRNPDPSNS